MIDIRTVPSGYYCPARIEMGVGVHAAIPDEVAALGADRVFLAVDRALSAGPLVGAVLDGLARRGIAVASFDDIEPDPSDTTVDRAFALSQAHRAQLVLAIGGGSTIDVAKAVGIVSTNGGRIHDYEGIDIYRNAPLPLLAMPSTAGTGAEVSGSCVITDTRRHLKMSIRHAAMNPARVAFLDPAAISTVPAHVAMHAGVDAFVHAFESFVSRLANPVTDALNLRAIELIASSIRRYVADRTDQESGMAMLVGSSLAGMAFGQTGLGNVHCLARFIGAFFNLSHGLSNALCLAEVAAFNRPSAVDRYARIADILAPGTSGDAEEKSRATVAAIRKLCDDLGVPRGLSAIGADPARYDEVADLAASAGYERWNPRPTCRDDFRAIIERIA